MKKRYVRFEGTVIGIDRILKKIEDRAKERGIDLDSLDDNEALFVASNIAEEPIPVLLGIK